jgi:hypothetical protein
LDRLIGDPWMAAIDQTALYTSMAIVPTGGGSEATGVVVAQSTDSGTRFRT